MDADQLDPDQQRARRDMEARYVAAREAERAAAVQARLLRHVVAVALAVPVESVQPACLRDAVRMARAGVPEVGQTPTPPAV